nr:MAG TPA: hypothetical protein [Caudoviricetes sp.]
MERSLDIASLVGIFMLSHRHICWLDAAHRKDIYLCGYADGAAFLQCFS